VLATRGRPAYSTSLNVLRDINTYQNNGIAELSKHLKLNRYIKSDREVTKGRKSPANIHDKSLDRNQEVESPDEVRKIFDNEQIPVLKDGEDIGAVSGTQYIQDGNMKEMLQNRLAASIGLPYNLVINSVDGINFSASKMMMEMANSSAINPMQNKLISLLWFIYQKHQKFYGYEDILENIERPPRMVIDQAKEATADKNNIANGTVTAIDILERNGTSFEEYQDKKMVELNGKKEVMEYLIKDIGMEKEEAMKIVFKI